MGPLLALASAVCYGIVDFTGGPLSRRAHFAAVAFLGQLGGLVCATAVASLLPAGAVRPADLLWGALSGVGSGLVLYLLAPQRQLLAVAVVLASLYPALPVSLGLALLHERVTRWQTTGLVGAAAATVLLSLG